jgi:hypothetical protein
MPAPDGAPTAAGAVTSGGSRRHGSLRHRGLFEGVLPANVISAYERRLARDQADTFVGDAGLVDELTHRDMAHVQPHTPTDPAWLRPAAPRDPAIINLVQARLAALRMPLLAMDVAGTAFPPWHPGGTG